MHYNYFRDYDPAVGRYVQSDPIGLNGGINTFGYVGANPLLEIDPRGLMGQGASGGSAAPGPYGFGGSGARRHVSTQCFLVCMTLKTAIGFSGGFGLSKGLGRLRPNVTNFAKALIDTIEDFGFRPINSLPGLIGSELISAWVCQDICVDPQKCTPETDDSLLGDARKVWRAVSEDVRHFTSQ